MIARSLLTSPPLHYPSLTQGGDAFADVPENQRAEKDLTLSAVKISGIALAHASPELQDDLDVVLAAVR